ncbi:cryptochrome/photolyase family protein [Reichenbachiella versicolor]|uniref:cryptochrome/photolyase family protein n=1 Tax=Reichenbachiella versicolor TaxID=1821036 RepID=UPI000D6DD256|nr:deoxyribodipyrimidine photo-lyase [Reichenbachiella versicolor]
MKINIFWFRRDLRLHDNVGLTAALNSGNPVLPIFIFDKEILSELESDDPRVQFIYQSLLVIDEKLKKHGKSLKVIHNNPIEAWKELIKEFEIESVFTNKDYEPYAIDRDLAIKDLLNEKGIQFHSFKDQVIFEEYEIVKADGKPYTVYTPYKNKWLEKFKTISLKLKVKTTTIDDRFFSCNYSFPKLNQIGFEPSTIQVEPYSLIQLGNYHDTRDFPAQNSTSYLSPHLRFGTVSVREMVNFAEETNSTFLSELIWREFFMQILFHFPYVVSQSFKPKYEGIQWRNDKVEFEKWCNGETGYPIVDAGMRELNATGYMHNRVRMITASFLIKHLLIDWRWGEAYFAKKLLDFDLSANNGNWQWVAGTGCDAAPYFRVFNPTEQVKKFDKQLEYIKKWVPELNSLEYPTPIVEHKFARERVLEAYKLATA